MRTLRFDIRLLVPIGLAASALVPAGCSSLGGGGGGGAGVSPKIRTITSVGDRPQPVVAGAPGDSVAADTEDVPRQPQADGRISGRVVDTQGNPVPNARVRLAVGGTTGGKLVRATTDDAGGFTLHGVRPGGAYTVIAEADDPQGLITGRSSVRAPNAQVQIRLRDLEDPPPGSNAAAPAPARSRRVNPISSREEADDEPRATAPPRRRRVNEEDLPPAPEAEAMAPADDEEGPEADRAVSRLPRLAPPVMNTGWRRGNGSGRIEPADEPTAARDTAAPRPPSRPRNMPAFAPAANNSADDDVDEGPNPLPPAIEPDATREPVRPHRPASTPVPARSEPAPEPPAEAKTEPSPPPGSIQPSEPEPASSLPLSAPAPADSEPPKSENSGTSDVAPMPPASEPASSPSALPAPAEPPAAPAEAQPDPAPANSTSEPAPAPSGSTGSANEPQASRPARKDARVASASTAGAAAVAKDVDWDPPYDPFAVVAAAAPPVNLAPAPAAASRALGSVRTGADASQPAPRQAVRPGTRSGASAAIGSSPAAPAPRTRLASRLEDKRVATCNFDTRHQRLIDFKVPDLQGQPVRFQELDADLILLDFWGTWCSYCTQSIPHLVELQKALGPRLRVVGIAYEEGPIEERVKVVSETARKLGINYTVALGGVDGPCPLQSAFHVSVYPTMILIDRYGRVLWRDQGATPATMTRLDRVLASASHGDHVRR